MLIAVVFHFSRTAWCPVPWKPLLHIFYPLSIALGRKVDPVLVTQPEAKIFHDFLNLVFNILLISFLVTNINIYKSPFIKLANIPFYKCILILQFCGSVITIIFNFLMGWIALHIIVHFPQDELLRWNS